EKAGTKIIEAPQDRYGATEKPVAWVFDDAEESRHVDEEVHAETCPHHAVVIEDIWSGPRATAFCTDPKAAGHHIPTWALPSTGSNGKRSVDQQHQAWKAKRAEEDRRYAIAKTLHYDFVNGTKLRDKATTLTVLRLLAHYYIPRFLEQRPEAKDRTLG